jgi:hypothetical protein
MALIYDLPILRAGFIGGAISSFIYWVLIKAKEIGDEPDNINEEKND